MFNQLVFLLYTVSAISGIVAFVYFTTAFLFSRQSLFRDYLFFLLSYSLMVVTATISVYLKVNSGENVVALHIFNVGMITGCHLLAFTLPRFVHIAVKNVFPRPWKSFFLIIFFSLPFFPDSGCICVYSLDQFSPVFYFYCLFPVSCSQGIQKRDFTGF